VRPTALADAGLPLRRAHQALGAQTQGTRAHARPKSQYSKKMKRVTWKDENIAKTLKTPLSFDPSPPLSLVVFLV